MRLYLFRGSDGYYTELLSHEKGFTEEEMKSFDSEFHLEGKHFIEKFKKENLHWNWISLFCKWLIQEKGFKAVDYTVIDDGFYWRTEEEEAE